MYLKQFENKNISINLELSKINIFDIKKHACTCTSSRCKCPSWPRPSSVTFRAGCLLFFLIINFSSTLTAKAGTRGSLNHRFQKCSRFPPSAALCDIFAYLCLKLKPMYNLFERNAFCLKPDETGFNFDCCMQSLRLAKFGVSTIKFDYRTRSKSIERLKFDWDRLPNVRLTTPGVYHWVLTLSTLAQQNRPAGNFSMHLPENHRRELNY